MQDISHSENRDPLLAAIARAIPDAMIVIDQSGRILLFSAAAERMFGYTEAEMLAQSVSILMPPPDRGRHDAYITRYLSTGEARIIGVGRVIVGQRADGTPFPMELSVGDASDNGEVRFVGFIRDRTMRRKAEVRLEELQHELAHVSRVSAMGTMAASLAHELNQPLTAVANYVEAARDLLETPSDETIAIVRAALNDAALQSIRAGQIVRRLRDFIVRGETEKRLESLRTLINEASALALIGAQECNVDVVIDIDTHIHHVFVDRIQIQQVLVNLIRNSVESMCSSAERKLKISAVIAPGNMVEVRVSDTGPGVSPEVEKNLFEPFASTKDNGMGLGLSICQTIIAAHGGRIWYCPNPRGGASFHFTLHTDVMERSIER